VLVRSRVASLAYAVVWLDDRCRVSDDAPVIEVSIRGFDCRLAGGSLTAVPGDDYADPDSARDVLEPGLRAGETHSEIVDGVPFRLRPSGSNTETVDEHGNTGPGRVISQMESGWAVEGQSVVRDSFPRPDAAIGVEGPVTSSLRSRWRSMEAGHEPLTSCAYWLLTRIEKGFGPHQRANRGIRREETARTLQIQREILDQLGDLSSVPDPDHGRKAQVEDRVLTDDELGWVRAASRLLMRRVLEHEAGVENLPLLTMDDPQVSGPFHRLYDEYRTLAGDSADS
jgi:hypothetical protein